METAGTKEMALYKQINAWGDRMYLTEMYNTPTPSILSTNQKVEEVADEDIFNALGNQIVAEPITEQFNEELPSEEYNQLDGFEQFKETLIIISKNETK